MNAERVFRGALVLLGAAAVVRGCYLVLFELPPRVWFPILIWLAAGVLVHDLLIAPTSLLLGRMLGRALGQPVRIRIAANALRGAWLGIGTVLLVGLPLIVGASRRSNWTVIPGRPVLDLFLSLALVILAAALMIVRNLFHRNRELPCPAEEAEHGSR